VSGGGESPASCTRARPRILHTRTPPHLAHPRILHTPTPTHLAHPASCTRARPRILHTPTPRILHTPTHSAGRGSQDFGKFGMFGSCACPHLAHPRILRTRSSAQTYCCRAGRNEGRKATRVHQGSPGFTRVHQGSAAGSPGFTRALLQVHQGSPGFTRALLQAHQGSPRPPRSARCAAVAAADGAQRRDARPPV